jgi:hypothetical protein
MSQFFSRGLFSERCSKAGVVDTAGGREYTSISDALLLMPPETLFDHIHSEWPSSSIFFSSYYRSFWSLVLVFA